MAHGRNKKDQEALKAALKQRQKAQQQKQRQQERVNQARKSAQQKVAAQKAAKRTYYRSKDDPSKVTTKAQHQQKTTPKQQPQMRPTTYYRKDGTESTVKDRRQTPLAQQTTGKRGNRKPTVENYNVFPVQKVPVKSGTPGLARSGGQAHVGNRSIQTDKPATRQMYYSAKANTRMGTALSGRTLPDGRKDPFPDVTFGADLRAGLGPNPGGTDQFKRAVFAEDMRQGGMKDAYGQTYTRDAYQWANPMLSPMEQLRTDAALRQAGYRRPPAMPSVQRERTAADLVSDLNARMDRMDFNTAAGKQELSSYDVAHQNAEVERKIQTFKEQFDRAKKAGDEAGMRKAHASAENYRRAKGYSGGPGGDEYITAPLDQEDYNRLNREGERRLTDAKLRYSQATTDEERAAIAEEGERIRRNPLYQETRPGATTDAAGRQITDITQAEREDDARRMMAAGLSVGQGVAGGMAYLGQMASVDAMSSDRWSRQEEGLVRGDPDYEDRIHHAYVEQTPLGPIKRGEETLAESLLRKANKNMETATEGMSPVGKFLAESGLGLAQMAPSMALAAIPGVGPALSMGALTAQMAGQRGYAIRQNMGTTNEQALRQGLLEGGAMAGIMMLSGGAANAAKTVLLQRGLANNAFATAAAATVNGSVFAAGGTAVRAFAREFGYEKQTVVTNEQLFQDAIVDFAFGAIFTLLAGARHTTTVGAAGGGNEVPWKYFRPDMDPEQAKAMYRSLSKQYHPDVGGDQAIFQEVSAEYARFKNEYANRARNAYQKAAKANAEGRAEEAAQAEEEFRQASGALNSILEDEIQSGGEIAEAVETINSVAQGGVRAPMALPEPADTPAEAYRREQAQKQNSPALTAAANAYDASQKKQSVTQTAQEIAAQDVRTPVQRATDESVSALEKAARALEARQAAERQAALNAEKWRQEQEEEPKSTEIVAENPGQAEKREPFDQSKLDEAAENYAQLKQQIEKYDYDPRTETLYLNGEPYPNSDQLLAAYRMAKKRYERLLGQAPAPEKGEAYDAAKEASGTGVQPNWMEEEPTEAPAAVEKEKAALRQAIRMPVKGTNVEALAAGARSGELSMSSVEIGGKVPGFENQQRDSFVRQVIEGAGTDAKEIHVDVPGDGTFTLDNSPESVGKVLDKLKVKANQEIFFTKQIDKILKDSTRVAIDEIDGEKFVITGNIAFRVGEDGAAYAAEHYKTEPTTLRAETIDFIRDIAKNGEVLTKQPVIVQRENNAGKMYVFQTNDGLAAFDKGLLDQIDEGTLRLGSQKEPSGRRVDFVVSVSDEGKIDGFVLGRVPPSAMEEGHYPSGKLKSIRNAAKQVAQESGAGYTEANKPVETTPATSEQIPEPVRDAQGLVNKKPHEQLADALKAKLDRYEDITSKDLAALAEKAFGGTRGSGAYDIKTAYDCLELAVNRYLLEDKWLKERGNGTVAAAKGAVSRIEELLEMLPTQTVRTQEQQDFQQFSTPPNIAYLAAWVANIGKTDVILEPSAGIGGLAVFGKLWGATVYGNELSPRRAEILKSLGLDEVFTENAEQIDNVLPDYVQPSVVLMNPPFSATAGRMSKNNTANAKRHIEQALSRLNDGGRLVAILGRGMSNDSKTFSGWWNELRETYDIRANLSIDGKNYKKYGTTFDVQIVVIDKTGPQTGETITGSFDRLGDVPAVLEEIKNDRNRSEGSIAGPGRSDNQRGGELARPVETGGGTPGRHDGDVERPSGGPSGDGKLAGAESDRNRGRVRQEGTGRAEPGLSQSADGGRVKPGTDEIGNGVAVKPGTERNTGPESELSRPGVNSPSGPEASEQKPDDETNLQNKQKEKPVKSSAVNNGESENEEGVFSEYTPPATPVKGAKKHPANIVESAAMAAVQSPKATYKPNLPREIIENGTLSDAQIVNVVYAGQAHSEMVPMQDKRKGYFIGDGTGFGKGRQISGIILDNFRQGRTKALWISKGNNLFSDAQRDWADLGGSKEDVFELGKIKADNNIPEQEGILFTTYNTLASGSKASGKTRLDQIVDWLGEDFDGVIAFDEAHNMGNLLGKQSGFGKGSGPSQRAIAGAELQRRLPNARVVYVSATMATDVNEMAFADRLGLWGPGTQFTDVNDFVNKISSGGIAAMELVARDMKAMGLYQARSISYKGVGYETLEHPLTPMQTEIYDTMSRAWQITLNNMTEALGLTGASKNGMAVRNAKSAFFLAVQRFYNQIVTSMAVPSVIKSIRKDLEEGRSVLIQLVNTNEAATNRKVAEAKDTGKSLEDLDITPREVLLDYLRRSFPVNAYEEYTDENGNIRSRPVLDSHKKPVLDKKAVEKRERLIAQIEQMRVPEGPLEMIFDAFGTDQVAEVTGRKRRIVSKRDANGNVVKVEERRTEKHNEADVQAFQDGKKRILIFSDAGGTGKSYHADLRAKNQQQRVHYLLQAGWSAPKAVQGFGRSNRSNQASAPIYKLVTTNIRGQKRFVSTIARRLDQLGALTKGQRQASGGIFTAKDNLESDLAKDALWNFYKNLGEGAFKREGLDGRTILGKLGLEEKFYAESGMFKMDNALGRDMSTFLNRILMLEFDEQNAVFDAFSRTFDAAYDAALESGTLDMGVETVRAEKIEILDDTVVRVDEDTGATTNYVQAKLTEPAVIVRDIDSLRNWFGGGFLGLYKNKETGQAYGVSLAAPKTMQDGSVVSQYRLQTPRDKVFSRYVEKTFQAKMEKIPEKEWEKAWAAEVEKVPPHIVTVQHMLTGTLLPIWNKLSGTGDIKVRRLIADDGRQYLGRIIDPKSIDHVLKVLGAKGRTKETFTPEQVVEEVFGKGRKAVLEENRVTLTKRRVGNEWRIEIDGDNLWYLQKMVPDIYTEYINFRNRYFVPNGENQASIVRKILDQNPLLEIEDANTGDQGVRQMRNPGGVRRMVDRAYNLYDSKHDFTNPVPAPEFRKMIAEETRTEQYFPKGLSKEFMKVITNKALFNRPRLYRGMDAFEFDYLLENKHIKSNSSYNFANQQGQTLFDEDAGYALSYATGFAPRDIAAYHYKQGLPSYLIEIVNSPDLGMEKNDVTESATTKAVDHKYITRIFEINYDEQANEDMVREISDYAYIRSALPDIGTGIAEYAHGVPIFYRDKQTGTILYAVQGPDGKETGTYITDANPDIIFSYDRLNDPFLNDPAKFWGVSGNEADLERMAVSDSGELVPAAKVRKATGGTTPHPEQWTTERIQGGEVKEPKPLSSILEKIQHDFGLNITTGHIRGSGVRGQFNPADKGIRSKIANDLPVASHELGHWFDDRFGITEGEIPADVMDDLKQAAGELAEEYEVAEVVGEGLAEFFRKFLANRETAAIDYPAATKYVLEKLDGQSLARLFQFADEINAYYSMDVETASSSIRFKEEGAPDFRTHAEKIKDMGDEFYQACVDSNHAIKRLDRATGGNAYIYATNAAYRDVVAARIIESALVDYNGQYIGPSLTNALKGVNTRNKQEWRDFGEYLVVRHGPERLAQGKRVFADDRKDNSSFMNRRREMLEEQYPEFKDAGTRVIQFKRSVSQVWGVDTGLISQSLLDMWDEMYKEHVPLYRAIPRERGMTPKGKDGFANQKGPFYRAKGSGLDIYHPVENIIDMVYKLVNAGTLNNVMRMIAESAERYGANATFMERVPAPLVPHKYNMRGVKQQLGKASNEAALTGRISEDALNEFDLIVESLDDVMIQYERGNARGDVVTVMRGGSPEFWKINDKALLDSVTSMSAPKLHGLLDAYAKTTRFMTANITGNNPIWSIFSNAPRDLATFFVFSNYRDPAKAIKYIGEAYLNAFRQKWMDGANVDPIFTEFLSLGGGHASSVSADSDIYRRVRKKVTQTAAQKIMDTMNPLNWITFLSDTIEMGPRFAAYKQLRIHGMSPHEAFYGAMDVTVNFRRGGYQSRQINKAVPFFGASVQGVDKFGRFFSAADAPPTDRGKVAAKRITAWVAASAAIAAMIYALNNGDEEKKKAYQQLSTYTKNSFFVIPMQDGKFFAIPKPRELAVVTSLFETILEFGEGGNKHAFYEFYNYAADNFLPSIVDDIVKLPANIKAQGMNEGLKTTFFGAAGSLGILGVGFYAGANRDFLGRPIESQALQNLEPRDRFTQNTSKMAYWIGQGLNVSPTMVDYIANQVLSYVWKVPRALFPVGSNMVDYTLGVKNTYVKDNLYSQDLVNWLYDHKDASARAATSDDAPMSTLITAKNDSNLATFYSRFNKLNRDNETTASQRSARQTVLDMIWDYQKVRDEAADASGQKAVYDVIRRTGTTDLMPAVMNVYVKNGDEKVRLTDAQYVEYQSLYNGFYWSLAEESLRVNGGSKPEYLLKEAKELAQEKADAAILKRFGVGSETGKYGNVKDPAVIRFESDLATEREDGSLKQEEVISVISQMLNEGIISTDDAYSLFHSRYDSDKNNPWAKK